MTSAEGFYDSLAADYDVLFEDWWKAAQWHGSVIARVLAAQGIETPARLLDCTCGIGTQALPLATLGFSVVGTDVSASAVGRARHEAASRGIGVELSVADVRAVREAVSGQFDAAISCDNALPHLLDDDELRLALRSLHSCLRPGGLLLASIRDYDALSLDRATGVPITLYGEAGRRHGSGQAWRWTADGEHVDITLFTLLESSGRWETSAHETRYRALRRSSLTSALEATGFAEVRWLMPAESGYFQPVVLATARD